MKVAYTNEGVIQGVAVDGQALAGDNVVTVADNLDVFTKPEKYLYVDSVFERRPYIVATPAAQSAVIGTEITVNVQAFSPDEVADVVAVDTVSVQHQDGTVTPESFALVAGVGSFVISSATPVKMYFGILVAGKYAECGFVEFTAE